jgi:ASCH domain
MPHLKALIIRSPYIELILAGQKTWEMRSWRNHWRGPVALIKKGSLQVSGVADLTEVIGRMSDDERLASQSKHCVLPEVWLEPRMAKHNIAWILSNPMQLAVPIPYEHVKGAQSWFVLDESTSARVREALPTDDARV